MVTEELEDGGFLGGWDYRWMVGRSGMLPRGWLVLPLGWVGGWEMGGSSAGGSWESGWLGGC